MPHLFFEQLERRRSTQTLFGVSNNIASSFPSQSYSSYSQLYGGSLGYFPDTGMPPGVTCYAVGLIIDIFSPPRYFDPEQIIKAPTTSTWNLPNSQNWLNNWTSPIKSNWQTPNYQTPYGFPGSIWGNTGSIWGNTGTGSIGGFPGSIWRNTGIPNIYEPIPPDMTCYFAGPTLPVPNIFNLGPVTKLKKVRDNLIAFFQDKGILSDKQGQRLLSSPFNKA